MSVFSPSVRMWEGVRKIRRKTLSHLKWLTSALSHHSVNWGMWKKIYSHSVFCIFCRVAAIIRLACFILTSPRLCMLSGAGRGLLVLADWTSQCCELEWHSVMDDIPHADLAKSLSHCCRIFLQLKFILHLAETGSFSLRLRLNPNPPEESFFSQLRLREWEYVQGLDLLKSPLPATETLRESVMSGLDPLSQMDTNPSLMCHFFINLKCSVSVNMSTHATSIAGLVVVVSWQKSITQGRRTFVECHLDFLHWIAKSRYPVEAFRLQPLRNKQGINNLSDIVRAVTG